jgi:two-component system, OmpR family, sensor kinase
LSPIVDRVDSVQPELAEGLEPGRTPLLGAIAIRAKDASSGHHASPMEAHRLAEIDQLKRRIAELESAVAARDNFLATAAHELRNPMTPILGQAERLNRMVARGAYTPAQISAGLDLLEQLVRLFVKRSTTLLDISRMTSGKLRLHVETFDAELLVRRVVKAHEPTAEHVGSLLAYVEQAPLMVALDALAVEQVLDNILLNALRYGCGRPIDIALGRSDTQIWMAVKDRGMGISQKDQSRIFQQFEQAVSSTTHGGFGVGLWVVGQLVQAMGGEIDVDSAIDEGTTFKVTLPRFLAQAK